MRVDVDLGFAEHIDNELQDDNSVSDEAEPDSTDEWEIADEADARENVEDREIPDEPSVDKSLKWHLVTNSNQLKVELDFSTRILPSWSR